MRFAQCFLFVNFKLNYIFGHQLNYFSVNHDFGCIEDDWNERIHVDAIGVSVHFPLDSVPLIGLLVYFGVVMIEDSQL